MINTACLCNVACDIAEIRENAQMTLTGGWQAQNVADEYVFFFFFFFLLTHMCLCHHAISTIWYQPMGGDALRLGR